MIFSSLCFSETDDELREYFRRSNLAVKEIYNSNHKFINDRYAIFAVVGYDPEKILEDEYVGIFLTNANGYVETLDIIPSERRLDFIPMIESASTSSATISIVSDYGELKRIKYTLNLSSSKKLVKTTQLQAAGIRDDLP
jgi:hypothetical protein